jgi:hypothetical protein
VDRRPSSSHPISQDIPPRETSANTGCKEDKSGYINPYDILEISSDTPMAEIPKAFAMAMKRRKYPADAIAKARRCLMNPKERIIADYLRPILPTVGEFKREDFSQLEAVPSELEFLSDYDGLDEAIAQLNEISAIDRRVGLTLIDFLYKNG